MSNAERIENRPEHSKYGPRQLSSCLCVLGEDVEAKKSRSDPFQIFELFNGW